MTFKVCRELLIMLIKLSIWLPVSVAEGPISWNLGPYLVPFSLLVGFKHIGTCAWGVKAMRLRLGCGAG